MDILYLLIPMSALLVLVVIAVFGWALQRGQFDDLDREGQRILQDDAEPLDLDQPRPAHPNKQSTPTRTPRPDHAGAPDKNLTH